VLFAAAGLCAYGYAETSSISPLALVGKWQVSEKMPNGQVMSTELALTQNMKFSGSAAVEGNRFWDYAGTWQIDGRSITWHYESSSRPLPDAAKTDIDDIVSVDSHSLVLVSRVSGKRHEYLRAK
jgi:hypothetical protein